MKDNDNWLVWRRRFGAFPNCQKSEDSETTELPIHDWTRVKAETWHDFHLAWIAELRSSLNGGLLPSDYYALAEQIIGPFGPDVLTLQETAQEDWSPGNDFVGLAVKSQPPKTRWIVETDKNNYTSKRRRLTIHHASDDRIIALIELVSPGNKANQQSIDSFVEKAIETLYNGYHLMMIDLFPPTSRDSNGLHGEIWRALDGGKFDLTEDEPLIQASYSSGRTKVAYVEPTAVGKELIDMPLFLTAESYIPVPLQMTYDQAYAGLPKRWQRVLEGSHPGR